ncbi:MAG: acyltransferase [Gammaproteobacteria bacterium]|nr:acyltransferase [Gammaproteobacteria bacterium]MBU1555272.1 acyltransferase [Gammaproteobacteria bacterium]MBU2069652.1 acyltransferase [Gammaproteobacteria bacterium]MBU2184517.1 acyltransferase [Gammaproteobacteria bacterium]MBU2205199.1 acyltransferase [Gammaproteobacteria bacterium]
MALLTEQQLQALGFKALGRNVRISDKASIYNAGNISIGDNVRIDDFVVLSAGSGGITLGSHIHIAVYTSLIGAGAITIGDFANLSSRVSVYSSSDDYSGESMTNPCVPDEYKNVTHADVVAEKHVIVGCGSVILPGVTLHEGVAVGALSLVTKSCPPFGIYAGAPARFIRERSNNVLNMEHRYVNAINSSNPDK